MKKRILGILTSLALAVSVMAVGAVPTFATAGEFVSIDVTSATTVVATGSIVSHVLTADVLVKNSGDNGNEAPSDAAAATTFAITTPLDGVTLDADGKTLKIAAKHAGGSVGVKATYTGTISSDTAPHESSEQSITVTPYAKDTVTTLSAFTYKVGNGSATSVPGWTNSDAGQTYTEITLPYGTPTDTTIVLAGTPTSLAKGATAVPSTVSGTLVGDDLIMKVTVTAEDTSKTGEYIVGFKTSKIKPAVGSVTVTPAAPTVKRGASQQFSAVTKAANSDIIPGDEYTWTISASSVANHPGITLSADGLLKVGKAAAENATVDVTATSKFDPTKSDTEQVTVGAADALKLVSFTATGPSTFRKGAKTTAFGATGFKNQFGDAIDPSPNNTSFAVAGVAGSKHSGTTMNSSTGILTVDKAETCKELQVTVTVDTVTATKTIKLSTGSDQATVPQSPGMAASKLGDKQDNTPVMLEAVTGTNIKTPIAITIAKDKMGRLNSTQRKAYNDADTGTLDTAIREATRVVGTINKTTSEKSAQDIITKVKDANKDATITPINFDGTKHADFMFPVTISLELGLANGDSFLYYYDSSAKRIVSIDDVVTKDKVTTFTITHASDYFISTKNINLNDPALGEGVTETEAPIVSDVTTVTEAPAPVEPVNPPTGNVAPIALLVCAVAAAGVVIVKRK